MFDGFFAEDFDAYLPNKWSSNMFTLQRRKVKDKLEVIGNNLVILLKNEELPLVPHLSDDFPSLWNKKQVSTQWLFFSRDVSAQNELQEIIDTEKTLAATLEDPTPFFKHIFIGVSVDQNGLEVGIRLHYDAWVDRKNILELFYDPSKSTSLIESFKKITSELIICLGDDKENLVSELTEHSLNQLGQLYEQQQGMLFIGQKIDRQDAVTKGQTLLASIESTINELLPLYQNIAWSPTNDAFSFDSVLEQKVKAKHEVHEVLEHEKAMRKLHKQEEKQHQIQEKERKIETILDDQAWREQERAKRRAAAIRRANAEFSAMNSSTRNNTIEKNTPEKEFKDDKKESSSSGFKEPIKPDFEKNSSEKLSNKKFESGSRRKPFDNFTKKGNNFSKKPNAKEIPKKQISVSKERQEAIQVGDRIAVIKGFLKGKEGIVQNMDEKGDLKVSFGMLSSRVSKKDVKGLGPAS